MVQSTWHGKKKDALESSRNFGLNRAAWATDFNQIACIFSFDRCVLVCVSIVLVPYNHAPKNITFKALYIFVSCIYTYTVHSSQTIRSRIV